MREFEHFMINGEIALADPKSLKAVYGHHFPEAYEQDDPRFLEEVSIKMGNQPDRKAFIVTPPSPGIPMIGREPVGVGFVVVEEEQPSGFYSEMGVHESRIKR